MENNIEETINEVTSKISGLLPIYIMNLENYIKTKYNGEFNLEGRIKTVPSIMRKFKANPNYDYNILMIPDLIGFRISVPTENDCIKLAEIFKEISEREINHFDSNSEYKALHYYRRYPYEIEKNNLIYFSTEFQIMTYEMRDWANLTHEQYVAKK